MKTTATPARGGTRPPVAFSRPDAIRPHPGRLAQLWFSFALLLLAPLVHAAEVIPPAPRDHFNDYAGIVRADTARQLDAALTQLERDTSNQIVVAIFPHLQSDSPVDDYAVRVFQAWGVGSKKNNNGALLLVFSQEHLIRIQTGYGLEGALPDALCKRIIANEITPRFRNGDFTGGLNAGVQAMIAATRGEYRGTGRTVADQRGGSGGSDFNGFIFFLIFGVAILSVLRSFFRRNVVYSRRGRFSPWINTGSWGGGSGGGWSGGGGGGGSFSGGGGSTGGGGASGSW